ncbi:hypothetical protein TSUD_288300 [Trifolium subterraneum]|uniref:Uncharacterized protein n=1 Tax=Trifolium subterraneum TaxID=3900 RepID=A0A2Z6NBN6_TRISU|nr:hypothetical protein TSUD_288300 [Trifolium subterraneum]
MKSLFSDEGDVWGWGPENGGAFTVNSTYQLLDSMSDVGVQFSSTAEGVFLSLSKSKIPSKLFYRLWLLAAFCVIRRWKTRISSFIAPLPRRRNLGIFKGRTGDCKEVVDEIKGWVSGMQ